MKLPAITMAQTALSRFEEAIQKEWLVTNSLGGYAASTALSINTRKYHGLLVAALQPPGNRTVCLAKLDEDVLVGKNVFQLGTNEFRGAIFPRGYQFLKEFSVAPFPRYVYNVQNIEVAKTVFMPTGQNAVAVVYQVLNGSDSPIELKIYPLLTCRHFHLVVDRTRSPLAFTQQQNSSKVEVTFSNPQATVAAQATEGEFIDKPNWVEQLYYREEDKRGESSTDDCYQPGYFEVPVLPKQEKTFAIITAADKNSRDAQETLAAVGAATRDVEGLLERELEQRSSALATFYGSHQTASPSDWLSWVLSAAEAFIVKGVDNGRAVIAGYFWFETWGRDTFISLPGLMLATGRFDDARRVLADFLCHCKRGLIPNCVDDKCGELEYNTVDATLWYVNAVLQYLKYTGDYQFVQEQLWATLKTIVESHREGETLGIRLDSDGLLAHGPRLTWMDAEVAGAAVTPRAGKAVEIQALWYNTLRTMQLLADRFDEESLAEDYAEMAAKAQASFNLKFWNAEKHCLFDVVDAGAYASLRPNQIIAAALDFTMLDKAKSVQVVDVVQRELLTPCGLRTLARAEPAYSGVYAGGRWSRDQAYHNGTVWAWLLGPYATAVRKVKSNSTHELKNCLLPLFTQQIFQAGLGTVSEIFDGDPPHTPRGCIAQAWSVAEPLRAYVEDVLQIRPEYERVVLQA
jgi:predicted glycogen debranching enzyme